MDLGANHGSAEQIASLIGWWQEAGLDTLIDEAPRDWLAKVERTAAPAPIIAETAPATAAAARPVPAQPVTPAAPAGPRFPEDLAGFQAWLATSEKLSMPLSARVAPMGDPASGMMVLVDLPEAADPETGRLLSGPEGALFDAMIGAMKRDRQSLYLAAMAPGRPSGGYVDKTTGALFNELARHHVALARPRALLLMGEAPSRAFLDLGFVQARGRVHDVQLSGGATQAVATFHPRTLLQHPEQKRRAWEDLQLLMKLIG